MWGDGITLGSASSKRQKVTSPGEGQGSRESWRAAAREQAPPPTFRWLCEACFTFIGLLNP